MIVKTPTGKDITLEKNSFSSGGEGDIYRIISPSYLKSYCAKILNVKHRTSAKEDKLKFMISNPPSKVNDGSVILAWPCDLIYNTTGQFLGFIMPLGFRNSSVLTRLTYYDIDPKLLASSIDWRKFDRRQTKSFENRLKLIYNLSYAIYLLHSTQKYVLKDFKPANVLVTSDGKITLVDMDSIQMCDNGKLMYPAEVLTPEYTPPECYSQKEGRDLAKPISVSWDCFSLAIVFYEILFGIHPFQVVPVSDSLGNSIPEKIKNGLFVFGQRQNQISRFAPLHNLFHNIPQCLKDLFCKAFDGPARYRPVCMDWLKELMVVLKVDKAQNNTSLPNLPTQLFVYLQGKDNKFRKTNSVLVNRNGVFVGFVSIPVASVFQLRSGSDIYGHLNCPSVRGCYFCFFKPSERNSSQNGIFVLDNVHIDGGYFKVPLRYNTKNSTWNGRFELKQDNHSIAINGNLDFHSFNSHSNASFDAGFSLNYDDTMSFNFCKKGDEMLVPQKGKYSISLFIKHTDRLTYLLKEI